MLPHDLLSIVGSYLEYDIFNNCKCPTASCRCPLESDQYICTLNKIRKKEEIFIGSVFINYYESELSKQRDYGDLDMIDIFKCVYLDNRFIITRIGYCETCYVHPSDNIQSVTPKSSDEMFVDVIHINICEKLLFDYLRSTKIGNQYIPIRKDDCDGHELLKLYDIIFQWFKIYKQFL